MKRLVLAVVKICKGSYHCMSLTMASSSLIWYFLINCLWKDLKEKHQTPPGQPSSQPAAPETSKKKNILIEDAESDSEEEKVRRITVTLQGTNVHAVIQSVVGCAERELSFGVEREMGKCVIRNEDVRCGQVVNGQCRIIMPSRVCQWAHVVTLGALRNCRR